MVLAVLPSISDVIDDAVHRHVGGPSVLSVELRQSIGREHVVLHEHLFLGRQLTCKPLLGALGVSGTPREERIVSDYDQPPE